ncbi:hypothetical protein GUJ93_ZPchr0010g10363 [Zizania palustris]|uniref:Uncharacterized protein n=1 Tax=Zizania palustris TaxID=103762 RepID=A0A8J5WG25_ZIZPA|nr:hypothetical protein GUJ93_ZPchr0010g10363 [Zizania palustris]
MASPMAITDDYFPLPDPSLDPSQLPTLVVQPDHILAIAVPLSPLPPSLVVDSSTAQGATTAAPIEIIYISDDDEMDINDTAATATDLEVVLLGEPKQEDPDDEEDPKEVEFYDDEE